MRALARIIQITQITRISGAALGASACLAVLVLVGQPAHADEHAREQAQGHVVSSARPVVAAKADRLIVTPAKGDLLERKPEPAETVRPVAAIGTGFAARGTPARKLVDVSVRDGGLWINSFATRTMPLDAASCAELSEHIMSPLPSAAVERLADDDLMRQSRACAANGSLLVTCYGGTATVSLRPLQHRDGCGG